MKERCLRKIFSISLHCCLWNGKLNAGTSFQSSFGCSFKIASNSNAHPSLGGGRGKYWKGLQMLSNVTPCMACQVHLCHYLSITICQRMSWVIWFEITFQTLKMGRKCAKTTNSLKFTSGGLWKVPKVSKCRILIPKRSDLWIEVDFLSALLQL